MIIGSKYYFLRKPAIYKYICHSAFKDEKVTGRNNYSYKFSVSRTEDSQGTNGKVKKVKTCYSALYFILQ